MRELLVQAIDGYLTYLRDGGEQIHIIPKRSENSDPHQAYVSAFGKCPKAAAFKRANAPMKFPGLDSQANPLAKYRMHLGVRIADVLQEAMEWKHSTTLPFELWEYEPFQVWNEHNVVSSALNARGRADILFSDMHGALHVLEIKTRKVFQDKVYKSDFFQLRSYSKALATVIGYTPAMHLVAMKMDNISTHYLRPMNGGFQFDDIYKDWNNPGELNDQSLVDEAEIHQQYLLGDKSLPFDSVLDATWECASWKDGKPKAYKTKENKPGILVPRCPYGCFFVSEDDEIPVGITNDGKTFVDEF